MNHLFPIHSVTDRQTDGQTDIRRQYHANSRSYCVQQHDRLQSIGLIVDPVFSARQRICYSALYAIARPSVCLSVRPFDCPSHGWISQKRLKLGSRNLHHRVAHDSSFLTLNFTLKFQREDRERGRRIREVYKKYAIFSK